MKLLNCVKNGLCAIAMIAVLSACGGGDSSSTTPEVAATTLKVVVLDEAASPVASARVRVAGADLTTDASGAVTTILPNSNTETLALITKAGFATNAKTAVIYSGKASELRVTLFAHQVVSSFAANAGVTVTPGGAKVEIPANATFRTTSGAAYTGTVTISSSYFNPDTVRGIQGFAQPYAGTDAGAEVGLISVGVIETKLTGVGGIALEMTNVAPATLTFPTASSFGGLATIPLWYYSETTKMWIRDGQATRQADGTYVGTVSHFTVWNLDAPINNSATLNICFRNSQGQPVSPVMATVSRTGWSRSGAISADGNLQLLRVPAGVPLELLVTNPALAPINITPLAPNENRQLACIVLSGPATNLTQLPPTTIPGGTPTSSPTTPAVTPTTPTVTPTTPTVTPTTPTVTPTTPTVTPTTPTVTPTTPTVSPTVPTVTPTTPSTTASFAGTYTGTYTGAEVGTFNVVVTSGGIISGNVFSQTFPGQIFPVSGQVGSNGQVSLTATGQAGSSSFTGSISATGSLSGTWRYNAPLTGGGTFSGQRR